MKKSLNNGHSYEGRAEEESLQSYSELANYLLISDAQLANSRILGALIIIIFFALNSWKNLIFAPSIQLL